VKEKKVKKVVKQSKKDDMKEYLKDVYGQTSVSDGENHFYSTGFLSLDKILGGGGHEGSFIEVYGPESGGKTTLCLHGIAVQQKNGVKCAYFDVERKFPKLAAKDAGVDLDKLLILTPADGEVLFQMMDDLLQKDVKFMIVDSVGAMLPSSVNEREYDQEEQAALPRLLSRNIKKVLPKIYEHKATIVCINQLRDKVGIVFGNPQTTPGGWAMKHYSSVRMSVRKGDKIKEGESSIGNEINITIDKNSFGPPQLTTKLTYYFNKGISITADLINVGLALDVIQLNGSWFSHNGENMAQGEVKLTAMLDSEKELRDCLEEEIKLKLKDWREFNAK